MTKPFKNPYASLPRSDTSQISIHVATSDAELIKGCRLRTGTLTGTVCTLIQELCNELRKLNITRPDQDVDFEQFIANLRITDGRGLSNGPASGPLRETSPSDDHGGTKGKGARSKKP